MALLGAFASNFCTLIGSVAEQIAQPKGLWEWLLLNVFDFIKNYGWRIVVFIILLKLLLLPLDLYQRLKMRKNQKITEKIKPQIEKLKKQYGNDSKIMSQKQMELNKKEGFSYFSSCIPMVATLVIFFTLFTGMGKISQYMIFKQYAEWYDVYTASVAQFMDENEDYRLEYEKKAKQAEEYELIIKAISGAENYKGLLSILDDKIDGALSTDKVELEGYKSTLNQIISEITSPQDKLLSDIGNIKALIQQDINAAPDENKAHLSELSDALDVISKVVSSDYEFVSDGLQKALIRLQTSIEETLKVSQEYGQDKVVEYNKTHADSFLWIKSIWQPDVSWRKPVFQSKNEFQGATANYSGTGAGGCGCTTKGNLSGLSQEELAKLLSSYTVVTAKLVDRESNSANGYFVLVILSVALSFLSQLITQKLQKKSGQFEANGATGGMGAMKVMMFIFPIIIGIFALTYTSAFSIYLVVNSFMTVLINVVITLLMLFLDGREKKKAEEAVIHYGRPDPNTIKIDKGDKNERNRSSGKKGR